MEWIERNGLIGLNGMDVMSTRICKRKSMALVESALAFGCQRLSTAFGALEYYTTLDRRRWRMIKRGNELARA